MNHQFIQETIDRLKYERDLTSGGILTNGYTIIEPMQFITIVQALELLQIQAMKAPMDDKWKVKEKRMWNLVHLYHGQSERKSNALRCLQRAHNRSITRLKNIKSRPLDMAQSIVKYITEQDTAELVELLYNAAMALEGQISFVQNSHEKPPQPATEWDYNVGILVSQINAVIAKNTKKEQAERAIGDPKIFPRGDVK